MANHQFVDVPSDAFYHAAVDFLVTHGITFGCAPGLFCSDDPTKLTIPPSPGFATMTVAGAAAMGVGTYNVVASCTSGIGALFQRGNLLVWAIAN